MRNTKDQIALTLTLSHPMGEGTAGGRFLLFQKSSAKPSARSFKETETNSPSPIEWERAGVRVCWRF
jgi:hypothetical protein